MTPRPSPRSGAPDRATLLAFSGAVLFGGANAVAARQTVLELAPFWSAAVRFAAASLLLAGMAVATRRAFPRGRSLLGGMLFGVVGFAAAYGFVYHGLQEAPAGTAGVLLGLAPMLTFLLAIALRQESFRIEGLAGALIAAAGIGLVFADQISADVPLGSLVLLLLSTACVAGSSVIVKATPRSDPFWTNAVAMFTGAALLFALSLLSAEPMSTPSRTTTWVALAYLITFGSVGLFALLVFVIERWTASATSYTTLLMPLVTVSLAALLTGERISLAFLAGAVVALIGVYIGAFFRMPRRRGARQPLPEAMPIEAPAADR